MLVPEYVTTEIMNRTVNNVFDYILNIWDEASEHQKDFHEQFSSGIHSQVIKSQIFFEKLETFKYEDTRAIKENTIELSINNSTRQSFKSIETNANISESEILKSPHSQLILGDPGAGKTTTMKRLVKESFDLLFDANTENNFCYSFPIVIKLAELKSNEGFFSYFAKNLGIPYQTYEREVTYDATELIRERNPDSPFADEEGYISKEITTKKTKKEYEYKIGNLSIESAISKIINEMNIIIFLDGLDEIHYETRNLVFNELKALLNQLSNSKLIITSRYFEEVDSYKNINKNEIQPLNQEKSFKIIEKWIDTPQKFWNALEKKPYKELAERPLFLFYLVMLYMRNRGVLPEQGVDVYRQVVLLVLREWDEQKEYKTRRYSKFKNFDTYKKEKFVSHLAFYLMYQLGVRKFFGHQHLTQAFSAIYKKHGQLSENDGESLIKDIETENGLIITSIENTFEFSHLSLQEYLCASHIVSLALSRKIYDYFSVNPEPFALAVVLSSSPSNWFAQIVLNNINEPQHTRKLTPNNIYTFLNRLITEGAIFDETNIEFGMAILHLIFISENSPQLQHVLHKFLKTNIPLESAIFAIRKFKVIDKKQGHVTIKRKSEVHSDLFLSFPDQGTVPTLIWEKIKF